jgi:hypothetical protein
MQTSQGLQQTMEILLSCHCLYLAVFVCCCCAGSRRRPCIVLDELDGAAGGAENHSAVAALVKLLTGEGSALRIALHSAADLRRDLSHCRYCQEPVAGCYRRNAGCRL